jgi:hypothetical protein
MINVRSYPWKYDVSIFVSGTSTYHPLIIYLSDYPGTDTAQSRITHGSFFHIAREEGLLSNHSIHGGIRCKFAVSYCIMS